MSGAMNKLGPFTREPDSARIVKKARLRALW
jgi:hypothetical protein